MDKVAQRKPLSFQFLLFNNPKKYSLQILGQIQGVGCLIIQGMLHSSLGGFSIIGVIFD